MFRNYFFNVIRRSFIPSSTQRGARSINDDRRVTGITNFMLTGASHIIHCDFVNQSMGHKKFIEFLSNFWPTFITTMTFVFSIITIRTNKYLRRISGHFRSFSSTIIYRDNRRNPEIIVAVGQRLNNQQRLYGF